MLTAAIVLASTAGLFAATFFGLERLTAWVHRRCDPYDF